MPGTPTATPCRRRIGHADEHVGRGAGRRLLARVDGEGAAAARQVDHHEAAAADAGRLRLDDVERIGDGHRRIDGVAAGSRILRAGFGAVGVGHGHHTLLVGRARGLRRRLAVGCCPRSFSSQPLPSSAKAGWTLLQASKAASAMLAGRKGRSTSLDMVGSPGLCDACMSGSRSCAAAKPKSQVVTDCRAVWLPSYQGMEYVFTLVKALQHSCTPSLTPGPESLTPPKGVTSSR